MKLAAVSLVFLAGCPFSSTQQRQVGLVPPPRPTTYDGQTMQQPMRVEGHASTTVGPQATLLDGNDNDHSAYVARDVIGGGVYGKKGDAELGVSLDSVRSRNAAPMTTGVQNDRSPATSGYTFAFSARHSMPIDNGFAVGLAADLGLTKVPILRDGEQVSDTAPLYRAAIVPSYRSGPITVFASLQLTNDIEVPSSVTVDDDNSEAEARAGGAALIPTAGASIQIGGGVRLTTQVAKPFHTATEHGPQVDFSLGYEFGSD